jgi:hypothetical protein
MEGTINMDNLHEVYNVSYKWNIMSMDLYPEYNGVSNYVTNINWKYDASIDEIGTVSLFGNTTYNSVPETYTPYDQLTESEVISWLDQSPETASYKENLDRQLVEKLNPPVISLALPWN